MDIRQLRYFLAVAEHRHFTRAAQASFVSQPALSQRIRALERELGAPLFDRLAGGVELTTAGRVLRGYAERILRELENAKVAVEEVTGTVRGELSVSTVHTANLALVAVPPSSLGLAYTRRQGEPTALFFVTPTRMPQIPSAAKAASGARARKPPKAVATPLPP